MHGMRFGQALPSLLLILFSLSEATARPAYEFIALEISDATPVTAACVNDRGQVAGMCHKGERMFPFVWDATSGARVVTDLELDWGFAVDLNDQGMLLCREQEIPRRPEAPGRAAMPGPLKTGCFVWSSDGGRVDLAHHFPDRSLNLIGLTDSGFVFGVGSDRGLQSVSTPVLFDPQLRIATPSIDFGTNATLNYLNENGAAIGYGIEFVKSPRLGLSPQRILKVWDGARFHEFPDENADLRIVPAGLNNRNQVLLGLSDGKNRDKQERNVIWTLGAGVEELPSPGKGQLRVVDLNNSGQVVGYWDPEALTERLERWGWDMEWVMKLASQMQNEPPTIPLLWENGNVHNLNDCVTLPHGWERLETANDINDAGWIVGSGIYQGRERAYVVRPVEPD
jgi:hypothetical protein